MLYNLLIDSLKEKCQFLSQNLCWLLVLFRLIDKLYHNGHPYLLNLQSMKSFNESKKSLILKGSKKKLLHSMKLENSLLKLTRQQDHFNQRSVLPIITSQIHSETKTNLEVQTTDHLNQNSNSSTELSKEMNKNKTIATKSLQIQIYSTSHYTSKGSLMTSYNKNLVSMK